MQSGSESNMSANSSIGASTASDKDTDSISGCPTTPEGSEKLDSKRGRKRKGITNNGSISNLIDFLYLSL